MEVKPGYKVTEVGVIPDAWETRQCSELCERIMVGIVIRPAQYYVRDGVPAFRSANIREDGITDRDLVFISEASNALLSKSQTRTGDVLTVRTGYPGTSAVVRPTHAGCNCIDILITRPTKKLDSEWLAIWINSSHGKEQVLRNQGGLAQKHFNVGDMRNLVVALPSVPEQRAIATALSDIDALLSSLDRLIAKKRDLKQAAMQQLLTGQTRLPGFQGEWETRPIASVVADLEAGVSVNSVAGASYAGSGEFGVLKTSCIADGTFDPTEYKLIDPRDLGRAKLNPRRNSLIISRMNTPNLVGEVGFVEHDHPALFLPDRLWMTRFRPDSGLCPKWLAYVLSSPGIKQAIKDLASGTSGSMKNIAKGKLLALQLAFPARPEQEAIANVLSDMDAELTALDARRDKTRALKHGMMQELLTGRTRLV